MFARRIRRREKFLKLDLYGNEVRYQYEKKYKYKTICGGVLSIFLIICLIVTFFIYFQEWRDTTYPETIIREATVLPTISRLDMSFIAQPVFNIYSEEMNGRQTQGISGSIREADIDKFISYDIR